MAYRYHNPVAIVGGPGSIETLPAMLAGRRAVLAGVAIAVEVEMLTSATRVLVASGKPDPVRATVRLVVAAESTRRFSRLTCSL